MRSCLTAAVRSSLSGALLPAILAAVLGAGVLVMAAQPVAADFEWCADDPLVLIGTTTVDISLAVQGSPRVVRENITSATITIHVAPGTKTAVLATTNIWFREHVVWVYDGVRAADGSQNVRIDVTFDAAKSLPVKLYGARVTPLGLRDMLSAYVTDGTTTSTSSTTLRGVR